MKNEEAIKQLNMHKSTNVWEDRTAEAIDMAIEALQAKTDGDTISRQAAIKNAHFPMIDDAGYKVVRVDDILALPSAEPREGEWIQNDNGTYSCSVCHSWIPEEQHHYARFCLYCGADMRGEEE